MNLVIGNEYYWLSTTQYALLAQYTGGDGLGTDFQLGPDGFYYAELSSISDDEYDWLLENDLAQTTYYSTSTQPGGNM